MISPKQTSSKQIVPHLTSPIRTALPSVTFRRAAVFPAAGSRLCRLLATGALLAAATHVSAQTTLDRQLSYLDLGLQGVGQFTKSVSGPVVLPAVDTGTVVSQTVSNTVGLLGTLRYTPKPYLGVEFNGGYVRYTESYNVAPFQIQTQANEFTFGYIVTPPYRIFGVKPYASVGAGTIRFAPTRGGGQGAPSEARMGEYYNIGAQKELFADNFGVRVGFRQLFYQAPDFVQNYLTINKHTFTTEPMLGFYLRF